MGQTEAVRSLCRKERLKYFIYEILGNPRTIVLDQYDAPVMFALVSCRDLDRALAIHRIRSVEHQV